jgi:hypothetical protein
MQEYRLLSKEVEDKFEIHIDYILIECTKCNSHWGVSLSQLRSKVLTAKDLICRTCAANEKLSRDFK